MLDRAPRWTRPRPWLATAAVTAALLLALAVEVQVPAVDLLGLAAAVTVAVAAIRRPVIRTGVQALTVTGIGALLVRDAGTDQRFTSQVLVPLVLLALVAMLASALASSLDHAHARQVVSRQEAERHARLLMTVRRLSETPADAVRATVRGLHELGYDLVRVRRRDRDRLVPVQEIPAGTGTTLPSDRGLLGQALAEGRTQVTADLRSDTRRGSDVDIGSLVMAPIVVQRTPWGTLSAGRVEAAAPTDDEVETVEVMAAHLSAALATERLVGNQERLLARLHDLEELRSRFVDRVSEGLRDPLTVVRGTAQTLLAHGDRIPPEQRRVLLERLTMQARDLRGTVEALLDFSRDHGVSRDPDPRPIDLFELLSPALAGSGVEVHAVADDRPIVLVDAALVRRAVELLRRADIDPEVGVVVERHEDAVSVGFTLRAIGGLEGGFARSLAEQLVVAAGGSSSRSSSGLVLTLPTVERGPS